MSTVNGPLPPRGPRGPGERDVKQAASELGYQLAVSLDGTGLGFVLVVCDFANPGVTAYASSAQREGAIDALEILVADLRRANPTLIPK